MSVSYVCCDVGFTRQLNWATEGPDTWSSMIPCVFISNVSRRDQG